jgi:RNA polymerase sigma factor (sigma-70 family)
MGLDQDNGCGPGIGRFEATRWSEVLEAAQSHAQGGREALARLCERYWRPLYSFARHRGHGPEDAQDLVQGFFEHLIQTRALGTIDQAKGRFRSFLLASFQNFISMEHRYAAAEKRGGRAEFVRIDWKETETRLGFEPEDRLTPETLYDARCAMELLGRATRRLEREQAARGNAEIFRILRPFLVEEGSRPGLSYEMAAQALDVRVPALKTLIHRLRRRHGQLLREEVARTLLDPNDVATEVHALCEALVRAGGMV